MALWVLRACFLLVTVGLGVSLAQNPEISGNNKGVLVVVLFFIGALAMIGLDVLIRKKRIDLITSIYFGLLIGLFLTYIIGLALTPIFQDLLDAGEDSGWAVSRETVKTLVIAFAGTAICYLCVSVLWQTRDDFRFIIPYVEFTKDVKGAKPYVLDTSVVIDGRIADIIETGVIDNQLIMPRFVLAELQGIADSGDKMRRARGRRGLDILNRLRGNTKIDFKVYDRELPEMEGQPVDMKLLLLARHLDGKVVTGDFNLNKVAKLHNVPVINLNEVANSLKPVFLPGEQVAIRIVKQGEGPGQGVGYLDDGTMIVVEDGRDHINQNVEITVTSMLQTSAGRMVFGKFDTVN
ncbi:MAG: PIN/TRAM domain-containing protein [Mariniblastus sp.]|nr:PIN/TRAM domain-containing protein [Mariniblastus sp.]